MSIGHNAVVEAGAEIGAGTEIGHNSVIGAGVVIGCDRLRGLGQCLGQPCGDRQSCHAVSGRADRPGRLRLRLRCRRPCEDPQLGLVRIGDDVEIGANTTIDRGAGPDTVNRRGIDD
ncbi:MAG: DapH/DapD/GlmU-related protein [Aliidongia sp.]